MNKTIYSRFAKVAVQIGINLKPKQEVYINISTRQREFAKYLVQECYKRKASKVNLEWYDEEIDRIQYQYGDKKILSHLENWEIERAKHKGETAPCQIYVMDDDPDCFNGLDMSKIIEIRQERRKVIKKYRDMSNNKDQWLIIAVPSIAWAKMVFPNESDKKAYKLLWEAIIKTTRIDSTNPVKEWKNHVSDLTSRAKYLNDLKLDYLKYKSRNGTDLTIKLHPNHLWQAASEKNIYGIEFVANMPTEEVFTMPLRNGVNGVVHSTKPLCYNGTIIDDFTCYFENGKCVKATASKGEDVLNQMINADESASFLGEVALVPYNSPINETGLLFYNTLFDENASCHLAFGESFRDNIVGYEKMTDEDFEKLKINTSIIHEDFMVGSKDLSILGYDLDGNEHVIFKNGLWAF